MSLPPDPGNIFPSDYHRRVLGHLPNPDEDGMDVASLEHRLATDGATDITAEQFTAVLASLKDDDYLEVVSEEPEVLRQSELGHEKLTGPALIPRQVEDKATGEIELNLVEDPPKEGKDLERAEEVNEERAAEDRDLEEKAKAKRKAELEKELAELEEK